MNRAILTCLRVVGVAVALQVTVAQQCYYPNGAKAPEKPCSSAEGSACCPDKWQCLDNGLCYYPPNNLHGRYSCTDQTWKSSGCASNMCTYGMSASGGESITQCSNHNNQWCCNADATHVNCCQESPEPRPFFALQDGHAYATIGASTASSNPDIASFTGLATSGGNNVPSSTPPPSSGSPSSNSPSPSKNGQSSATPPGPSTPVTSLQTKVSSGSASIQTVVETVVTQPPAASSTSSLTPSKSSSSNSKIGVIVGCSVGIPLGFALIGILIWLLRKHRKQKKHPYSETPDPYTNGSASPEFAGGAKLHKYTNSATKYKSEVDPGVPELAGQSVGPERPYSIIKGRAELDSGAGFVPGTTPHAPHLVGVGGGNGNGNGMGHTPQSSWDGAPPGYSPSMNQNAWAPGHAQTGSVGPGQDGAAVGGVAAQMEGGGHIPYRTPPGHAAAQQGGLQNVPEMAELSAVRTPPAELRSGRTPPA